MVRSDDRGRVVSAGADGLHVVLDHRTAPVRLPGWYVVEHVRQRYSITAHQAQGASVDQALTLIDDTCYRELGYSGLSRARQGTELYLTGADPDDPVDHQRPQEPPSPVSTLCDQLGHSRAEDAALRAVPTPPQLGDPAAAQALWHERDRLAAHVGHNTRPDGTR
jgi:hypothetical protein